MHTLALDGRMGASGDMLLGALLAAGADRTALVPVEEALSVRYEIGRTTKNGIAATTVEVLIEAGNDDGRAGGDADKDSRANHDHEDHNHEDHNHEDHDHDHSHDPHDHDHEGHQHDGSDAEGSGPLRTYPEVVAIVESMGLPDAVEADATAVFGLLGEAEAAVHDTDLQETHFHEVGADDAVADVVGTCLLVADLGVERVVTTPLAAGGGTVEMSHGTYPVPPPAVVELAERADWELKGGPVESELLTPTGAAILAHFAEGLDSLPPLRVQASGYGAGRRDFPEHPNVLRAIVGETRDGLLRDEITVLETNLDDASPEVLGGLQETLATAGALDVTVLPSTMKKSRPGHLVKVVVKPEDARRVARRLAEETGTLGVRETAASHRWIAGRRTAAATLLVDGEPHTVAVKIGTDDDGEAFDVSTEYDDAAAVAADSGLPVREVLDRAEVAVRTGGALSDVLVHAVEADRWKSFADSEYYAPPSLEEVGYVHASTPQRAPGVAQYNYPDADNLRLLVVDREAVEPEIRYEEEPSGAFPHIYGELNTDAVLDVLAFQREDGRFVLPEELRVSD